MATINRDAWLKERMSGIGGSEAAAVMGLSPFATPVTIWLEKTGRAAPKEETEAMRIGTELEDYVARSYSRETGRKVTRYNHMIHDGCLLGNFDRLVVPDGAKMASHKQEVRTDTILECKTASREWEDGVPINYQMQVQHYMGLVPCLRFADVAVLHLGHKHFEIYRVERDQAVIDHIRSYLIEWWNRHVVNGEMPKPTNEADCKLLWARSNPGKQVESTDAIMETTRQYAAAKAELDVMKKTVEALRNDIECHMQDGEVLVDGFGKPLVTWKSPAKETVSVDWESIARELGATDEIIAAHTTRKIGARRFLCKYKPEEDEINPLLAS